MGLEGRSPPHPSDQAIRPGATCHSRFSASEYQYGENVRHENTFQKIQRGGFSSLASQPTASVFNVSTGKRTFSIRRQVLHSNVRSSKPARRERFESLEILKAIERSG